MGSEIVELREGVMEFERSTHSSSSSSSFSSKQQPLLLLNHVSFVCKLVSRSVKFYEEVLGFVLIKRPSSFDFEGAWLFNHGIGIHLLEVQDKQTSKGKINPKDNHISFQTPDMGLIMTKLEEMNIEFVTAVVKEGGVVVDQLFFHDPDGYMIEICNCQNLPILPISSCPLKENIRPTSVTTISNTTISTKTSTYGKTCSEAQRLRDEEALMMFLAVDIMHISF